MVLTQIGPVGCGVVVAPGILPRVPGHRVVPRGLLPFGLGGQPLAGPAGEGVGLVPADVHHRFIGGHQLGPTESPAQPVPAVAPPEQRGGQADLLHVVPAGRGPPAPVGVTAVGDEVLVVGVRHRDRVQPERTDVHLVRRPLVVQRPRVRRRAHREGAGRDQGFRRPRFARRCRRRWRVQDRIALSQLVGGQHRLGVLLLVLGDHAEHEPALGEPASPQRGLLEQVDDLGADLGDVAPGLRRVQQRQCRPVGPRVLERVVELIDGLRQQRVAAADVAQQPQLLLIADVRQVPDQRGHQPGVLTDQVVVVHGLGERRGAPSGPGQIVDDPGLHRVVVGRSVGQQRVMWPHAVPSPKAAFSSQARSPVAVPGGSSAGERPRRVQRCRYPST